MMMSIPHLFRCPISLDLFTDPVTLCTGQTYDRPSIERWLADGNLTCPVTMQRLHDPSLVPNHTLRHLIDQWLLADAPNTEGSGSLSEQDSVSPNHGLRLSLAALKFNLQSPFGSAARKLETLRRIRAMSLESDVGQSCLIQMNFFSDLLRLLFQSTPSCDPEFAEVALECLLSLSQPVHSASLGMFKEASCMASLVRLLQHGSLNVRTKLCCLLAAITASPQSDEISLAIGQTPRVMEGLVSILRGRPGGAAADAAAKAISSLCSLEPNRHDAVKSGAVDALLAYLPRADPLNVARALATLELLAELESGGKALIRDPGAVRTLVEMVFRVSSDTSGSEHAVGTLLTLCRRSGRARAEVVDAGLLTQLLMLLQSQCSSKAKGKARALLKLLSSMWG